MKICKHCDTPKQLKEFNKHRLLKDGHANVCRECNKNKCSQYYVDNKERLLADAKIYNNTKGIKIRKKIYDKKRREQVNKNIPWKRFLTNIKGRCNNHKNASYKNHGGKGIKCLITTEELEKLWIRDKAWLLDYPSIDRKENNKNYTYDNCRFIEMVKNCSVCKGKMIYQYTLCNVLIREWMDCNDIKREFTKELSSIYRCCNGKLKTAHGFIWRYIKLVV